MSVDQQLGTEDTRQPIGPVFKVQSVPWPMKTLSIGCPETSVANYLSTLCNIPENRRYPLHFLAAFLCVPVRPRDIAVRWTPVLSCHTIPPCEWCTSPSLIAWHIVLHSNSTTRHPYWSSGEVNLSGSITSMPVTVSREIVPGHHWNAATETEWLVSSVSHLIKAAWLKQLIFRPTVKCADCSHNPYVK